MTTPLHKLTARINAMPPDELREFAANIVKILYLEHDEENEVPVLDSRKVQDDDTAARIGAEVIEARLDPESL